MAITERLHFPRLLRIARRLLKNWVGFSHPILNVAFIQGIDKAEKQITFTMALRGGLALDNRYSQQLFLKRR